MSLSNFPISFCCGVYNEGEILTGNINKLKKGLDHLVGQKKIEIILISMSTLLFPTRNLRRNEI